MESTLRMWFGGAPGEVKRRGLMGNPSSLTAETRGFLGHDTLPTITWKLPNPEMEDLATQLGELPAVSLRECRRDVVLGGSRGAVSKQPLDSAAVKRQKAIDGEWGGWFDHQILLLVIKVRNRVAFPKPIESNTKAEQLSLLCLL